ncbi:MAG TPA: phosphoribosylamine--glycine ligase, partial [Parafilimonas sp.]|nr:phosphoribosylamine--glycine ligase [Parafilimonas sp.]
SGGREHALAWKISQSKHCDELFIAPGNAGTSQCGKNINISVNDFETIKKLSIENNIEMIVVGPEEPLVKGVYDFFVSDEATKNIIIIGPSANGAQLEGSKAFSKKFMQRQNIPTAAYAEFTKQNFKDGKKYIQQHTLPVVLKADGLAAGKGVVISATHEEASNAFEEMIIRQQFGEASSKVVIEEFLDGIELSVFVLTNGKDYKIIGHAKDYKRIGVGDTGLNTGGMGCVSPLPFLSDEFMQKIETKIIQPTINGLQKENIIYNGFIFFGLIKVGDEPFVIEYNCRMGDPETEVVIPRLKNDIVELFLSIYNNTLRNTVIEFDERACATIVAVSKGYPGDYEKGIVIDFDVNDNNNLSNQSISSFQSLPSHIIFHAGTKMNNDGTIVTNGGRVLAVTSFGRNIADAVQHSKNILKNIYFEGMYFRNDIGYEFRI